MVQVRADEFAKLGASHGMAARLPRRPPAGALVLARDPPARAPRLRAVPRPGQLLQGPAAAAAPPAPAFASAAAPLAPAAAAAAADVVLVYDPLCDAAAQVHAAVESENAMAPRRVAYCAVPSSDRAAVERLASHRGVVDPARLHRPQSATAVLPSGAVIEDAARLGRAGALGRCSAAPLGMAVAGGGGHTLGSLAAEAGGGAVERRLLAAGMAAEAAAEKRAMFASAAQRLLEEGLDGGRGATAFWVPGRVELSGKHTDYGDYAGGRSLLAATTRGFAVVSVPRADDVCRIFTTFGLGREMRAAELRVSRDLEPEQGHWSAYPATVIRRLARNFGAACGADVALECDLPQASGMSTSSAVICYMWMVLADANGIRETPTFRDNLSTDEELY
ncbi:unnamed protein product [Prorocentrum cordatum]|uniref:GHMP kinase N-terminal domain-containing protein n=1 Tax=Prorocentrum cordatum TaxID=2364126 RepID=A0ABN9WVP2_9DINO|nr:unnamed protein product [Polarella glacialis]